MNIETAKSINSMSVGIVMAREGIGEFSDSDMARLKETSLADMLEANRLMSEYEEQLPDGGKRVYVHTTDMVLAELYCRLHSDEFYLVNDLVKSCSAIDILCRYSINGHGILVDGHGNFSFIELNSDGDGSVGTIAHTSSINELLVEINNIAIKLEGKNR